MPDSPRQLRIDEIRSNSPIDDSSPSAESRKSPVSLNAASTNSYDNTGIPHQTNGVLKSALLTNAHLVRNYFSTVR